MAQQAIDVSQLSIDQLNSLKQQIEEVVRAILVTSQEAQFIQNSIQQLKVASSKFQDSKECLTTLKKENDGMYYFCQYNFIGKQILVPMTASMYVPATLIETDSVLVDIGTGYYVKKVGMND